jgi:hypothetical protein
MIQCPCCSQTFDAPTLESMCVVRPVAWPDK